jgi:hypothetical protein
MFSVTFLVTIFKTLNINFPYVSISAALKASWKYIYIHDTENTNAWQRT